MQMTRQRQQPTKIMNSKFFLSFRVSQFPIVKLWMLLKTRSSICIWSCIIEMRPLIPFRKGFRRRLVTQWTWPTNLCCDAWHECILSEPIDVEALATHLIDVCHIVRWWSATRDELPKFIHTDASSGIVVGLRKQHLSSNWLLFEIGDGPSHAISM